MWGGGGGQVLPIQNCFFFNYLVYLANLNAEGGGGRGK